MEIQEKIDRGLLSKEKLLAMKELLESREDPFGITSFVIEMEIIQKKVE